MGVTKEKKPRSRGRCNSCKKLKIKCSEEKPTCEYCAYTNRVCEYPILNPPKKDTKRRNRRKTKRVDIEPLPTPPLQPYNARSSESSATPSVHDIDDDFEVEPPYHYDELTRDLVLTQSTSMLGISKFELRLLQFFDQQCIYMFSFGIHDHVHNTWKYKVPYLFLESELVRKSMFSLAATVLSAALDLNLVQNHDAFTDERSLTKLYNLNPKDRNSMFMETANYFLEVIRATRDMIAPTIDSPTYPNFEDPLVAKELTVSSILIFIYLVVNPQQMVPLIDFTRQSTDLIQISKGMRSTTLNCYPVVSKSEISGILNYRDTSSMKPPCYKTCNYPVIAELKRGLEELETDEVSSSQSRNMAVLKDTIELLAREIYGCVFFNFPIPLYKLIKFFNDDFHELLYAKDPFALRVMFVYVALCSIANFKFYHDKNVWWDFLVWYKEWKQEFDNEMDRCLYLLVTEKQFIWKDFEKFDTFDPIEEYNKSV